MWGFIEGCLLRGKKRRTASMTRDSHFKEGWKFKRKQKIKIKRENNMYAVLGGGMLLNLEKLISYF